MRIKFDSFKLKIYFDKDGHLAVNEFKKETKKKDLKIFM